MGLPLCRNRSQSDAQRHFDGIPPPPLPVDGFGPGTQMPGATETDTMQGMSAWGWLDGEYS